MGNEKSVGLRQGELAPVGWRLAGMVGGNASCGTTTLDGDEDEVGESEVALATERAKRDREVAQSLEQGRRVFREATFGDESFWGGRLRLHEAIAGEDN